MEEQRKDYTQHILDALRQGVLVVAPVQSGKTTAIAMLLKEVPDAVAVVADSEREYLLMRTYYDRYQEWLGKRIITVEKLKAMTEEERAATKLVIDDYALADYDGPYFAAASSYPGAVSHPGPVTIFT